MCVEGWHRFVYPSQILQVIAILIVHLFISFSVCERIVLMCFVCVCVCAPPVSYSSVMMKCFVLLHRTQLSEIHRLFCSETKVSEQGHLRFLP